MKNKKNLSKILNSSIAAVLCAALAISMIGRLPESQGATFDGSAVATMYNSTAEVTAANAGDNSKVTNITGGKQTLTGVSMHYTLSYNFTTPAGIKGYKDIQYAIQITGDTSKVKSVNIVGGGPFASTIQSGSVTGVGTGNPINVSINFGNVAMGAEPVIVDGSSGSITLVVKYHSMADINYGQSLGVRDATADKAYSMGDSLITITPTVSFAPVEDDSGAEGGLEGGGFQTSYQASDALWVQKIATKGKYSGNVASNISVTDVGTGGNPDKLVTYSVTLNEFNYSGNNIVSGGLQGAGWRDLNNIAVTVPAALSNAEVKDSSGNVLIPSWSSNTATLTLDDNPTGVRTFVFTKQISSAEFAGVSGLPINASVGYRFLTETDTLSTSTMTTSKNIPASGSSFLEYTISGYAFDDANSNGEKDMGEPGIGGVTVTVKDLTNPSTVGTYATAADGFWISDNITEGHEVEVSYSSVGSKVFVGASAAVNGSKVNASGKGTATLTANVGNFNAGYIVSSSGNYTVTGRMFYDADGNGVQSGAKEVDIEYSAVIQTSPDGNVWSDTTTITGVGLYSASAPAGAMARLKITVNPSLSSSIIYKTLPTAVGGGTVTKNLDIIGNSINPLDFGRTLYLDNNNNSVYDSGEGITATTVQILRNSTVITSAITNGNGEVGFNFVPLTNTTYTLAVVGGISYNIVSGGSESYSASSYTPTGTYAPMKVTAYSGSDNVLSGTAWKDVNGDGIRLTVAEGGQDTGIAGVNVSIVGPETRSATTDALGYWSVSGLASGTYVVTYQNLTGYTFTQINQGGISNSSKVNTSGSVTTSVNSSVSIYLDAGYFPTGSQTGNGNLAFELFSDNNKNGVKDVGEDYIAGISFSLYRVTGSTETFISNYVTSAQQYSMSLVPGTYKIKCASVSGYNTWTVCASPSIGVNGISSSINIADGGTTVVRGGLYNDNTIPVIRNVSGVIFNDTNGNGFRDAGELNIPNLVVFLYNSTDLSTSVMQASSTSTGFTFTNPPAGSYKVYVSTPANYQVTTKVGGSGNALNTDGYSDVIVLGDEAKVLNIGYRVVGTSGSNTLVGHIYTDINFNGSFDANDQSMPGATVELYEVVTTSNKVFTASTVSGSNGEYGFVGLRTGTYEVVVIPPSGVSFDNGDLKYVTTTFVGSQGTTVLDIVASFTINGSKNAQVSIGDLVWDDTNGNGLQDFGEPGVPNVPVSLYSCDTGTDIFVSTVFTAMDGKYLFSGLSAGVYKVHVAVSEGMFTTTRYAGVSDLDSDFDSEGWSAVITAYSGASLGVDCGLTNTGTSQGKASDEISGVVWYDDNANGETDRGEITVSGAEVTLIKKSDSSTVATERTNRDGEFVFSGLSYEEYSIEITVDEEGSWSLKGDTNSRGVVRSVFPGGDLIMAAFVPDESKILDDSEIGSDPSTGYWPNSDGEGLDFDSLPTGDEGSMWLVNDDSFDWNTDWSVDSGAPGSVSVSLPKTGALETGSSIYLILLIIGCVGFAWNVCAIVFYVKPWKWIRRKAMAS